MYATRLQQTQDFTTDIYSFKTPQQVLTSRALRDENYKVYFGCSQIDTEIVERGKTYMRRKKDLTRYNRNTIEIQNILHHILFVYYFILGIKK